MNTAITGVIVLHNIQNIDTVTYCTMLSAEVYWNETKNRIWLVVCSSPAKIENFQSVRTAFPLIVKKAYDKKNDFLHWVIWKMYSVTYSISEKLKGKEF